MLARLLSLLVAFTLATGCATQKEAPRTPPPAPVADDPLWPGGAAWADSVLATLTLEEKVSQLFSVAAYGYYASADDPAYRELIRLVEGFGAGGVIFFQGTPLGQAVLANELQARAHLPLLVSQDMEWGAGMRVDRTTTFPRTMALGAARSPELAYAAGFVTAQEARALGTHHVFAPVADVNNNPYNPIINVRSFSEDPRLVGELAAAFAEGVEDGGAIATLKHFPGHGDTATDSHADLPVLPFDAARLDTLELVPFRQAIDEGVQSVMVGHLAFPELEPDVRVPATLSPRVTEALLRDRLGFDGLIVTDALNMAGVTKHFTPGEIGVRALEAGADMLLMSTDPYAAREAILDAIRAGRLTEDRIDASARRILMAKAWLGLPRARTVDLTEIRRHVATSAHRAAAEGVARASLTLLRNEDGLLPLSGRPRVLSVTLSDDDDPTAGRFFAERLRAYGTAGALTTRLLDRRSTPPDYDAVVAEAADYDVVLVPTFLYVRSWSGRIALSEAHQAFINRLVGTGTDVVLIAFGNPYMIMGLEEPAAYVVAYSGSEASQTAVAQGLWGKAGFHGRLPITIPDHYPFGAGLDVQGGRLRADLPAAVGLDSELPYRVDSLLTAAIRERAFPGAAVAAGRGDAVVLLDGYGYHTYAAETPVTPASRFDLASLTKVVATTTVAMRLVEAGRLDLDAPLARYLPAFGQNGKAAVTVRDVLTHTSGLVPFVPFHTLGFGDRPDPRAAVIDSIMTMPLAYPTGSDMRYSDLGLITLALAIEAITGEPFADVARREVFEPLGMSATGFLPTGTPDPAVVPTEVDDAFRARLVQGEVHDETAWLLGGAAGHAGLFSTAEDLARFAHMLLTGRDAEGRPYLRPETIRLFTTAVDPGAHSRALGWDTKSPEGYSSAGVRFGPRSFGHTGFTGTSLWIDPDQELFAILLTNRVYPTRENRGHVAVRPAYADLVHGAILGPISPLVPLAREATAFAPPGTLEAAVQE